MNEKSLRLLEYPKILRRLAQFTFFSASKDLALNLHPSTDIEEVRLRQKLTSEGKRLLSLRPSVSVGGARDVRGLVDRTAKAGVLEPFDFLDIAATMDSARTVRQVIEKFAEELPNLARIAAVIADAPELEKAVARCIGRRGEMLDDASPALGRIRNEMKLAHDRLLKKLDEMLGSTHLKQAIQEPIVTIRNGRYVIPVKADFKGEVRGIIHDESASGATVFVEPMATVELNNQWRKLQLEEQHEVERILRELSAHVAREGDKIKANVGALGEIDLALGKARYSAGTDAVEPLLVALGADGGKPAIRLRNARHPLLTGNVVPISVELGDKFSILVVTGPNTGGKTVTLKTVGLLTLMAQAGLHIPADDGSQVRVFARVFADIGDEQSIEQNLSTFSSHMSNIIKTIEEADENSLVLLDELGAGTDPSEGSALARALIAWFLERGVAMITATHYPELKTFAYSTPGLENACVEFDPETLSPTYKLSIGLPGRSNALAIAQRLGLSREIVETARTYVSTTEQQMDSLLREIQAERDKAALAAREAEVMRRDAAQTKALLDNELAEFHRERQQRLSDAQAGVEQELAETRQRLQRARKAVESIPVARPTREAARAVVEEAATEVAVAEEVLERLPRFVPEPVPVPVEVRSGDQVLVRSLKRSGQVLSDPDECGMVEVQVGNFRMRMALADLAKEAVAVRVPGSQITYPQRRWAPDEIEVRAWRVEDVLPAIDKFLDEAYLAGLSTVRIIHGKGTGTLRRVVREMLTNSPLVKSFRTAELRDGGEGVTVAELAQ